MVQRLRKAYDLGGAEPGKRKIFTLSSHSRGGKMHQNHLILKFQGGRPPPLPPLLRKRCGDLLSKIWSERGDFKYC